MYHNSGTSFSIPMQISLFLLHNIKGDVSERRGYDLEQLVSLAKVQVRQQVVC
jgi:hypothetical protein